MSETTYLRPKAAAAFLNERFGFGTPSTLAKGRCFGGGPRFRKIGAKTVVYAEDELITWAEAQLSKPLSSTSEAR